MAAKRELIEPHEGDKRYVRRNKKGQFKESDDVGRSLAQARPRTRHREAKATAVTAAPDDRASEAIPAPSRSRFGIGFGRWPTLL